MLEKKKKEDDEMKSVKLYIVPSFIKYKVEVVFDINAEVDVDDDKQKASLNLDVCMRLCMCI